MRPQPPLSAPSRIIAYYIRLHSMSHNPNFLQSGAVELGQRENKTLLQYQYMFLAVYFRKFVTLLDGMQTVGLTGEI